MANRYIPDHGKINPAKCVAQVGSGFSHYQCSNKRSLGEWCKKHHPEEQERRETMRRDKRQKKYKEKREKMIAEVLEEASLSQLYKEIMRRKDLNK